MDMKNVGPIARRRIRRGIQLLGETVAVLPPREKEGKKVNTGVLLSEELLKRLEEVAELEHYSRNEVISHFLRWALAEYEKEKRGKK